MRHDEYIPIDSIEDINTGQISLTDINKRYIDRNGMRYATRFNLKTRKIEVVRIVKGKQEAEMVRKRVMQERTEPVAAATPAAPSETIYDAGFSGGESAEGPPPAEPGPSASIPISGEPIDASSFVEHQFTEECATDFERVKERLNGIINFLKNSKVFENTRADQLSELFREIDIECIQRCDQAVNYYKELVTYPRQVSYYMSRLSPEQKTRADAVESDEEKMVMVRRWEIQLTFEETYTQIYKTTEKLLALLNDTPGEELEHLPHTQKQAFEDGRVAGTFLLESCMEKLNKIRTWKHKYG